MPIQALYRAVGYFGSPLPGVPFDKKHGVIPNREGQVLAKDSNQRVPGIYATGWIKRGPIGVIGTNKSDAAQTVAALLADLPALPRHAEDPLERLRLEGVHPTSFDDWLAIDAAEVELGEQTGRPRVKIEAWDELLRLANAERRTPSQGPAVR